MGEVVARRRLLLRRGGSRKNRFASKNFRVHRVSFLSVRDPAKFVVFLDKLDYETILSFCLGLSGYAGWALCVMPGTRWV